MNRPIYGILICIISLMSCVLLASDIYAQTDEWHGLVSRAGDCLAEIQNTPVTGIPEDLLNNCSAIAVFPGTTSAGFLIGGQYGSGIIMARDQNSGKWSPPAVFDIAGGSSVGFQMGGENTDLIFLFMGNRSIHGILQGGFTTGADTRILPGPVGLKSRVETGADQKGIILSYVRSRDVVSGIKISGADLTENLAANKALYGADLSAGGILIGNKASMPKSASAMIKALKTSI